MANSEKMIIKNGVASYMTVFEGREDDNGVMKFSTSILLDKEDSQVEKINEICDKLLAAKFGNKAKFGKVYHHPLRDGDEERPDDAAYAGKMFFNASAKRQPGVVDQNLRPVIDDEVAYSGCTFNFSVNFYSFEAKDKHGKVLNKGVAAGLNNMQLVKQGDRLDGRAKPEEEFEVIEGGEENQLD
jgi:hypothetical protein